MRRASALCAVWAGARGSSRIEERRAAAYHFTPYTMTRAATAETATTETRISRIAALGE